MTRPLVFLSVLPAVAALAAVPIATAATVFTDDFEEVTSTQLLPITNIDEWFGNPASTVTAENGVTPRSGERMFWFSHPTNWVNTWHAIDISSILSVQNGTAVATLSAWFNRDDGAVESQLRFANIDSLPAETVELDSRIFVEEEQPVNRFEWTEHIISAPLPAGMQVLAFQIATFSGEGHYADDVRLTITPIPEPSTLTLVALALLSLLAHGRRHPRA